jgi:hypothetical protein
MAQTKQITFNVDGERIQIKARRCAHLRYTVEVNGWRCWTKANMSLFDDSSDYSNQALDQAIEKGLAKWLKATH